MAPSSIASLISSHLGVPAHVTGLVGARSFRSITLTRHRTRDQSWRWAPHSVADRRCAAVVFADDPRPIAMDGLGAGAAPVGLFLPPDTEHEIEWAAERDLLAVWIPERLLQEFTEGATPPLTALVSSPLTIGFRTFVQAVVRHGDEGSSMSQYAIERLVAEMTFGALVERQSVEAEQRPSSLVERARSVMLMRREDPSFSTPQLAGELHISARQLQRAFAQAGLTPGDMLRRMRVELAESLLRNPLYSGLTVDEISRYAGFTSALQLRRALHAEGAPAPTALRRASQ